MTGWLSRWLKNFAARARVLAPPSKSSSKAANASGPTPLLLKAAVVTESAQPVQPSTDNDLINSFTVRRPLIGSNGELVGFEFRLTAELEGRVGSHPTVQAAYAHLLLAAVRPTTDSGRAVLVTLPGNIVSRHSVLEQVPQGIWLVIHPWFTAPTSLEELSELRLKRVQIGRVVTDPAKGLKADFVQLAWRSDQPEDLWLQLAAWQAEQPAMPLMVSHIDNIDDLERALRSNVKLVCGRVDASKKSAPTDQRTLQPGAMRLAQMLNQVMQIETPQIAEEIRADVVLSYKLLRFANTPALGLAKAVESVDQAVMMLGRKELYRWLSILFLASADGRKASRAVQEIALWRARFLEGLAQRRAEPIETVSALFTAGLLSLMDVLLQIPLQQALQPLRLSEAALQALLERRGPWAPYFQLMSDVEKNDLGAIAKSAIEFGEMEQLTELSDAAWEWAAKATGHSHSHMPA
jgi:EAL and modified HD-GYP domain-containing signal transduction protein